jgi:hypothetical protein
VIFCILVSANAVALETISMICDLLVEGRRHADDPHQTLGVEKRKEGKCGAHVMLATANVNFYLEQNRI